MHSRKPLGVGLFFWVILYLILAAPANSQETPGEFQKPEAVLQVGHRRAIRSVAFSPDGRWLASGAKDNTIKIWEVGTGRLLRTLYGHGSAVNAVAASPDGKLLASASGSTYDIRYAKLFFQGGQIGGPTEDTSVRLWDVATGRQIRIFSGHTLAVMAVAFSADGHTLTSASSDFIKVWDVVSGKELRSLAVFPPPASTFGDFVRRNSIMGASKDKRSDQWQKAFKQLAAEILISGRGDVVAAGQPGKNFRLFDTVRVRKLDELDVTANPETPGALAFSRDGLLVAYVRNEKEIAVRSVSGGKDLWRSPLSSTHTSFLCFTPDGQAVVQESLEGGIRIIRRWSAAAGKPMGQATIADDRTSGAIAVSPDGRFLVMLARGAHFLEVREAATGQMVRTLGSSSPRPRESVDAELRKRLEGLGLTNAGELDEAAEDVGAFSSVYRGGEAVTFTLDGRWLLIKRGRAGSLSTVVWDTSTGTQLQGAAEQQFKNLGNPNQSPEGRFDIKPHYSSEKPNGLRKSIDPSLAFTDRGPTEQRIVLRDARNGQKLHGFNEGMARDLGTVPAAGFSLDGSRIAISGYKGRKYTPQVFIFDTVSGKKVAEFDRPEDAKRGPLFALALSTDARFLAAGYETKDVEMIDAVSGKTLAGIAHLGGTAALSFNPNGRLIALLGKDGDCYLLDANAGQLLATLVSNENGDWLVVSPDGKFDGSPGGWSQILWRFSGDTLNVTPVETFFNEFYYPGLLSEILAGKKLRQTRDFEQLDRRQPSVEISAEGTSGPAVKNRTIKVRVNVAEAKPDKDHSGSSTVRDVRLFRNGSLVTTWHGEVDLNTEGKATLEATIPIVAGPNRLTAYAFNGDNIKSPDASLVITGSPALKRAGVTYIVSVGINEYSNAEYNLKFAVADAEDLSAELKVQQSKVGATGKVEVVSLLNAEATKKNVLLALRRLAGEVGTLPNGAPAALEKLQPAQPEDEVFLYFAGHGAATDQRFFLIPYDLGYPGSRTGLDLAGWMSIMDHSISDLELEDALEKVDARDLILVIDACNSGQALEAEERRRGPMNSRGLAQLAYEKGMYVLTAAQGYQAALEVKELGHGLLTYALVEEGLKTAAADRAPKDGKTVAREWMDYATVRVPELQQAQIDAAQKQGRSISFVENDPATRGEITQGLQRPRVFYRREPDPDPMVVAKP